MANKKNNNSTGDVALRHLGVIVERIDDNVKTLVEGHQALDKKIDDSRKEMDERFGEVDYKIDVLVEGQQSLDKKIDNLHGEMNFKFEAVFDELHLIRNELKEKVSRDEFMLLEKRVASIEKKLPH